MGTFLNKKRDKNLSDPDEKIFKKISSLKLPRAKGKHFTITRKDRDIEEFLNFEGASKISLINEGFIEKPDVIIIDYRDFIRKNNPLDEIIKSLNSDQILIATSLVAPGPKKNVVELATDSENSPIQIPTLPYIIQCLEGTAYKIVGEGFAEDHEEIQKLVFHVRKKRPSMYLMMSGPATGKSTISRSLFNESGIKTINGDQVYLKIFNGELDASERLKNLIKKSFKTNKIGLMTKNILENGWEKDIVDVWVDLSKHEDVAIDSYIPLKYQKSILDMSLEMGFFPVSIDPYTGGFFISKGFGRKRYTDFFKFKKSSSKLLYKFLKILNIN